MNLNFIQDNDKVHVQTQNHIAYKQQIILKTKLLKQDYKDYKEIHPHLIQINAFFNTIVQQLFQHMTSIKAKDHEKQLYKKSQQKQQKLKAQEKKKKISIPYGIIKKLDTLKNKFIKARKVIQNQNFTYRYINLNYENDKKTETRFYKQMLKEYEQKRQQYKRQTLKLQDRVQEVQTEVKKVLDFENHKYVEFNNKIMEFQALNKYQRKLGLFENTLKELIQLSKVKIKISQYLQKDQRNMLPAEHFQQDVKFISYGRTLTRSLFDIEKKISVLNLTKNVFLYKKIREIQKHQHKVKVLNQKLKSAILKAQNYKYFFELQKAINNISSNFPQIQNTKHKQLKKQKITKTDYLIYLKELDYQVKQYFKCKEINFKRIRSQSKRYLPRSKSFWLGKTYD